MAATTWAGAARAIGFALDDAGWEGALYRDAPERYRPFRAAFVPYCFWDNRAPGAMQVWVRTIRSPGRARNGEDA